ncbi:hypothetical protein PUN28_015515 [Cardiocondyla obscurior]|uniref:Uncharacterized protein n=1 Tax=Cardiocondyla obscurior TaxID=286306 RepID=A0AAW2EUK4_9HYME
MHRAIIQLREISENYISSSRRPPRAPPFSLFQYACDSCSLNHPWPTVSIGAFVDSSTLALSFRMLRYKKKREKKQIKIKRLK